MNIVDSYNMWLIDSLEKHNYSFAKSLILNNHPLNTQNSNGDTALMIAINNRLFEIAKLIIESKQCTNGVLSTRNNYNSTVLSIAVGSNNKELVELILKKMKYNIFRQITEERENIDFKITEVELSNLDFDPLSSLLGKMTVSSEENVLQNLKDSKQNLSIDLDVLNDGVAWLGDNMNKLGINDAIKLATKLNNTDIIDILIRPPKDRIVLEKVNMIKREIKRPRSRSKSKKERVNVKSITHSPNKKIKNRKEEQAKKRGDISEKFRFASYEGDEDDDVDELLDGRKRSQKFTRRRRSKSRKKSKSRRKSRRRRY